MDFPILLSDPQIHCTSTSDAGADCTADEIDASCYRDLSGFVNENAERIGCGDGAGPEQA